MVEFIDKNTNEKISYYINKNLKVKWDKIRNKELVKKDEDRVYIVDGRERVGKSVFALQQAKYIDPTFNLERVCFTPEEFLDAIRKAPKGSCVIFDEAFRGLSSKSSQSKVNKKIVQALMEMGQRNLIVFIVLPTIFLLEIYPAVLRSEVLFHIYKDSSGRRRWRLYNYQKKSQLYREGKKKGLSYKQPRITNHQNRGRFYGIYAIEEKSYRNKKAKSLREMGAAQAKDEEGRISLERKIFLASLVVWAKKLFKWSQQRTSEELRKVNVNMTRENLSRIVKKAREEGKIVPCEAE